MDRNERRARLGVTLRHIVLIVWCASAVFPLLWVLMIAFKDNGQIFTSPFAWPNPIVTGNFPTIFSKLNVTLGMLNSLIYSAASVILVALLSAMVGFYLAKCAKGRALSNYFTAGMMIPVQAIIVPLFINIRNMGLMNSRLGIILTYTVTELAFAVFIMTGFIRGAVPDEVIEAATIDGASPALVFFRIALPLSRTGLVTVGTFVFLHVWNEFLYAMIFLPNAALSTLNLMTFKLRGQYSSDYGLIGAGIIILVLPALVIYALFQEQVVKGLTAGAVKG